MFQTHFRLSSAFRLFKQRADQPQSDERILELVYNVLTDSLALVTTFTIEEHTELTDNGDQHSSTRGSVDEGIKRSKWNELFVASFKQFKRFMRQTGGGGGMKFANGKSVSFDSLAALELN